MIQHLREQSFPFADNGNSCVYMVIVQFTFSFRSGHTTSVPSLTDDINSFIHMVFSLTPLLDINNNYIYRLEVTSASVHINSQQNL